MVIFDQYCTPKMDGWMDVTQTEHVTECHFHLKWNSNENIIQTDDNNNNSGSMLNSEVLLAEAQARVCDENVIFGSSAAKI